MFFALVLAANAQNLNKQAICKKWYIHKYRVYWKDYAPEKEEQNDYIQFNNDMTFNSVDAGEKSTGTWSYDNKKKVIKMYNEKQEALHLKIEELTNEALMFNLPQIPDMKGVDVYYSVTKKTLK